MKDFRWTVVYTHPWLMNGETFIDHPRIFRASSLREIFYNLFDAPISNRTYILIYEMCVYGYIVVPYWPFGGNPNRAATPYPNSDPCATCAAGGPTLALKIVGERCEVRCSRMWLGMEAVWCPEAPEPMHTLSSAHGTCSPTVPFKNHFLLLILHGCLNTTIIYN